MLMQLLKEGDWIHRHDQIRYLCRSQSTVSNQVGDLVLRQLAPDECKRATFQGAHVMKGGGHRIEGQPKAQ